MKPGKQRFLIRLQKAIVYAAEIDAPDQATAEAIASYLMDEGLWSRVFNVEIETFDIFDTETVDTGAGQ